jgi:hypothetical protein
MRPQALSGCEDKALSKLLQIDFSPVGFARTALNKVRSFEIKLWDESTYQ